jgi:hypothetical protein
MLLTLFILLSLLCSCSDITGMNKQKPIQNKTGNSSRQDSATAKASSDSHAKESFDWVVEIDDSVKTISKGGTDTTMQLRMKAANFTGMVKGKYAGEAMLRSAGVKRAEGFPVAAAMDVVDKKVEFELNEPLAPLTPDDSDSLAPLTPDDSDSLAPLVPDTVVYDYQGEGVFHFTFTSVESSLTPKLDGGIGLKVNIPFTLKIIGSNAVLDLEIPQKGGSPNILSFKGKSIGYGKASGAAKTPLKPFTK